MSDLTPAQWLEQPVRITRDGLYFGDEKLPGCIAEGGVTFKPGGGVDINKLTVEFLVGTVTAEDPLVDSTSDNESTRYAVKKGVTE